MIMVTGATGNVGREVVNLLLEAGEKVVAVTRSPDTAELPDGVEVVGGDPSRPETLAAALRGIDAIFLNPATIGNTAAELLSLAAEQGVRRVVLLSGGAVEFGDGQSPLAEYFLALEGQVKASGLDWTFLRPGEFAANTRDWAPQIRATGAVRGAYGDAVTLPVHERDIAAVVVAALLNPGHVGRSYLLTGSPVTPREKVRLIGEAIGEKLVFEEISHEQARQALIDQGAPADVAETVLNYQADPGRGSRSRRRPRNRCWAAPPAPSPTGRPTTRSTSGPDPVGGRLNVSPVCSGGIEGTFSPRSRCSTFAERRAQWRGAYMMTATPSRQSAAPSRSNRSGR